MSFLGAGAEPPAAAQAPAPKPIQLPPAVIKNIADRQYDRRKVAALEVEQLVKRLAARGETDTITALVDLLNHNYATSSQPNARKGGLLCLAATAVGLADAEPGPGAGGSAAAATEASAELLHRLVPAILGSFTDPDARVRYYAVESLYNVAKSTRHAFVQVFPQTWDGLFHLCADSDQGVKDATSFLDNLVKDIVAESHDFNAAAFVPTLEEYLTVTSPHQRQFLLGWLGLLDSLPEVSLAGHLPRLLPGLLGMLGDGSGEIRAAATKLLAELQLELNQVAPAPAEAAQLALILAAQLRRPAAAASAATSTAGSPKVGTPSARRGGAPVSAAVQAAVQAAPPPVQGASARLTALRWLGDLVGRAPRALAPHCGELMSSVLPCLGSTDPEISRAAHAVNAALLRYCTSAEAGVDTASLLAAVTSRLDGSGAEAAGAAPGPGAAALDPAAAEGQKLAALSWVRGLLRGRAVVQEPAQLAALLAALCDALAAPSDAVVNEALGVVVSVAAQEEHFETSLRAVLGCFRGPGGARVLQRRGALVLQTLCGELGTLRTLRALSALLGEGAADAGSAASVSAVVQAINLVLLTAAPLAEVRALLQGAPGGGEGAALFADLFQSWSVSCAAALALALLSQAHELASEMVAAMAQEPVAASLSTIVEASQLVSLLEAPAFASTRLQLLAPGRHVALVRAMYGLLMLLPQGGAFELLQARLQSIPTMALLTLGGGGGADAGAGSGPGSLPEAHRELLALFTRRQIELAPSARKS